MDIKLPPTPWYRRHSGWILLAVAIVVLSGMAIASSLRPTTLRVSNMALQIDTVHMASFTEYIEAEAFVQPIATVRINALEGGTIDRVVAEEGQSVAAGDTLLLLSNPELLRSIADEQDEWQRKQNQNREQQISIRQKSLQLRSTALDARYELSQLSQKLFINREEARMGIISQAELRKAEAENDYRRQKAQLQIESLQQDSLATLLHQQMIEADINQARKRITRMQERADGLVVRSSTDGQVAFANITIGQRISPGEPVCEVKVLKNYKLSLSISDYYLERVTPGLAATITYQKHSYPLKVSKVLPEVRNQSFAVELTFASDSLPSNIRLGKSYMVRLQLSNSKPSLVIDKGDFGKLTQKQWIYALAPGSSTASKRQISIGRQNSRQYEILSGLNEGDAVITYGYQMLESKPEIVEIIK